MVVGDRRWQQRKTSFSEFLKAEIAIDSYTMRGRNVLINIALLPVTHSAAHLLAWSVCSFAWAGSRAA
jgi:hypothetical protein